METTENDYMDDLLLYYKGNQLKVVGSLVSPDEYITDNNPFDYNDEGYSFTEI